MVKKVSIIFLLLFVHFSAVEVRGYEEPLEAKIQSIIKERVDKYNQDFGIVVGIVSEKGSKIIGYGKLNKKGSRDVDGNTLFELGSITKTFTAVLLADMVERGELGLDDPIDKFLPGSVKPPTWNGKKITLLDLATHTSGLPNTPDNSVKPQDDMPGYENYSEQQLYDFLSHYTLTRAIGSKVEYSNMGMGLLGHILSLKAGLPYDELVIRRICAPLGMNSTLRALPKGLRERMAVGRYLDGQESKGWEMPPVFAGAGGLRSTAGDMIKYLAANLGLLKSPLSAAMQKTHEEKKNIRGEVLKIGLAWFVIRKDDLKILIHEGGTEANSSFIAFDPQEKIGVVVLSNSNSVISDIGLYALTGGKFDLLQLGDYKTPEAVLLDAAVYDDYVGTYQTTPNFFITITRENDRLFGQGTGQPRFELFPQSENTFFLKAVMATITFVRDSQGKVIQAIIHSSEGDEVSTKIK